MSEEKDRVDGTADETKAETKSSDHHTEDTYEKVCFMCRRPESKAGKMITLPGNINICPDCMQKSFDTMNQNPGQINEMMNNMNNMPNIGMFDLSGFSPRYTCILTSLSHANCMIGTSNGLPSRTFSAFTTDTDGSVSFSIERIAAAFRCNSLPKCPRNFSPEGIKCRIVTIQVL